MTRPTKDELWELVGQWREKAEEFEDRGWTAEYFSTKECADDLEALLER